MRSKQNPTVVNVTPNPRKFLASTRRRIENKKTETNLEPNPDTAPTFSRPVLARCQRMAHPKTTT
jgi:hypothetical protein